jgi:hypothetical protein
MVSADVGRLIQRLRERKASGFPIAARPAVADRAGDRDRELTFGEVRDAHEARAGMRAHHGRQVGDVQLLRLQA